MKLTAEKITKEFIRESGGTNRFTAVSETSFELSEGKVTVLSGRSGSGKTTLLNILSGLLPPTTGKVLLDGRDIYAMPDKKLSQLRNVSFGIIPQGQTAIHSLTVRENILLPFTLYGDDIKEASVYANELMKKLDIAQLADIRPAELSGGELRRMAIARAVMRRPAFLFADEPTGDLDDENTKVVFEFLRSAAAEGASVLIVTHEDIASEYADKHLTMTSGVLCGS